MAPLETKHLKLLFVLLLPLAAAATSPADKLDPRYVSQLRVELRNVARPEQCLMFWRGVSEKLHDVANYSLPEDGADFELLADLSRALNFHRAYHKLSEFVDECTAILKGLPKDKVASHTASRSRALELPTVAPAAVNQQELEQLKKETHTLQAELDKKEKLLRELEAETKIKLDKLNVALLAREQQLQEATKARELGASKEKELCQAKEAKLLQQLDEQEKLAETREKQSQQNREELNKLKKELEDKSKLHEQKLELLEKVTKEKEQLLKEIERLKVDQQSSKTSDKVDAKCSLKAEQRKFQQDRKDFVEKIELLRAEVKSKTEEVELEKEKSSKKLQEVLKEVAELKDQVKKREKCPKETEEPEIKSFEDMKRLYNRIFFDNHHPLEPGKTFELMKVLERMLEGHKDPEVKGRYKMVERFIKVSELKQKRCSKYDWDKLKDMIQRHTSSVNIQHYLQFCFIQRQDYCSRLYPRLI